jgi:hypothetical protein
LYFNNKGNSEVKFNIKEIINEFFEKLKLKK